MRGTWQGVESHIIHFSWYLADAVAGVRVHLVVHHAGVAPHHVHQPAEQLPHEAVPQHLQAVDELDVQCDGGVVVLCDGK